MLQQSILDDLQLGVLKLENTMFQTHELTPLEKELIQLLKDNLVKLGAATPERIMELIKP